MRYVARSLFAALLLTVLGTLAGCATTDGSESNQAATHSAATSSEVLKPGDPITVVFSDLAQPMAPFEERVKADGTITLIQNQSFVAAGKTRGDLEREIRARYVPNYYRNLTVTIKPQDRFFYVGGQVNNPSRQPYLGEITVSQAITSAGGFTDFANKKKVRLTRTNGKTITVNCVKALDNPAVDATVYPGDSISVPRSL